MCLSRKTRCQALECTKLYAEELGLKPIINYILPALTKVSPDMFTRPNIIII